MVETLVNEKANMYPQLENGMKFRRKIWERETVSKTLGKYIAMFDYLIILSALTGSVPIASFATVAGTAVGTAS